MQHAILPNILVHSLHPTRSSTLRIQVTAMKIFFSVGEPSGDLHGANLIRQLRRLQPGLQTVGYGGPQMADAGCRLHRDMM